MLKFIPVDEFIRKTKTDRMTFYRRKFGFKYLTVKLKQEFILVEIKNNKIKAVDPSIIKEFQQFFSN
ncbi:hypothetical protein SAMN06265182_0993 [Persephonella hydrogeniphila]|uniref:Uncharacterized protein n=1 Tax=Persephonella hydrogeniphila TaxID=198703 RepID=A0A285NE66_9AQUI|nr:hypothetical protein [Persephonella hydrogeniphila]SNZ07739.1 hypothetical protein SAMN06265182_0993 [Persephonella hydrogeniphila]